MALLGARGSQTGTEAAVRSDGLAGGEQGAQMLTHRGWGPTDGFNHRSQHGNQVPSFSLLKFLVFLIGFQQEEAEVGKYGFITSQ